MSRVASRRRSHRVSHVASLLPALLTRGDRADLLPRVHVPHCHAFTAPVPHQVVVARSRCSRGCRGQSRGNLGWGGRSRGAARVCVWRPCGALPHGHIRGSRALQPGNGCRLHRGLCHTVGCELCRGRRHGLLHGVRLAFLGGGRLDFRSRGRRLSRRGLPCPLLWLWLWSCPGPSLCPWLWAPPYPSPRGSAPPPGAMADQTFQWLLPTSPGSCHPGNAGLMAKLGPGRAPTP